MEYKELKKEEFHYVLYQSLICQFILQRATPFKIIRIRNRDSYKFVILKVNERGVVSTRSFCIGLAEGFFITQWIGNDFPDADFEEIDNRKDKGGGNNGEESDRY